ncbi:MAG: L-threonylcarbamoyladenylate synthase [Halobacteriaceae archaeon]
MVADADVDAAVTAVREGGVVVYPTETVYGLGADALDPDAVERVFALKGRARDRPVSLGVESVEAALAHVRVSETERAFMDAFLPGPVTVVCEKRGTVPDALTAGRDRVGVRVPDHDLALTLLERAGPLTATSANVSGGGSVREVSALDARIREAAVVLDDGPTPGTESTVVDVATGTVHRRGAMADRIEAWLQERA